MIPELSPADDHQDHDRVVIEVLVRSLPRSQALSPRPDFRHRMFAAEACPEAVS